MFDRFRKKEENEAPDVKGIRDRLVRFIKDRLQQWEGGEGGNIRSVQLFLTCSPEEMGLYESAVFIQEPNRFKEEYVQKMADDFALELPAAWEMEILFTSAAPPGAVVAQNLPAALMLQTGKRKAAAPQQLRGYLRVLNGEAEQEYYTFDAGSGPVNIGRDKKVQTADGFYRENTVAFPASSNHESNKFVSRQHGHITWDAEMGAYLLFADEGGVPPRNKIKVRPRAGGDVFKLQSVKVGYPLQHGDQIILGDSALLEFGIEV